MSRFEFLFLAYLKALKICYRMGIILFFRKISNREKRTVCFSKGHFMGHLGDFCCVRKINGLYLVIKFFLKNYINAIL